MPRIVDHHQRRNDMTTVARRLILTEGPGAVTVRSIAQQLGFSTKVVSHYFESKQELLLQVYLDAHARAEQRFKEVCHREGASASEILEVLLPITKESQDNWQVWFALWSQTVIDPSFRAHQVAKARELMGEIQRLITYPPWHDTPNEDAGRGIFSLITGIATQATLDPEYWSPDVQRQQLVVGIERLVAASSR